MAIIFVRHAESEANIGGVSKPNKSIMLSPKGQIQARELAENIHTLPVCVFISEYIRTLQTARPVLKKYDLQATVLPCLNEFNAFSYDRIEGMTGQQRLPLTRRYWRECDPVVKHGEGAQSFNDFCHQVRGFMGMLDRKEIPDGSLIFGHGMWLSVFMWLNQTKKISSVTKEEMGDFFKFMKLNHPSNCEMIHLTLNTGCM